MEIAIWIQSLWILVMLMSFTITSSNPHYQLEEDPSVTHNYDRFPEVEKACRSVLRSASRLDLDANRIRAMEPELSFVLGDWEQDSGDAPLMPFDGSDASEDHSNLPDPLRLATLMLTHVDLAHRSHHTAVNVSGVLGIGISRNGTAPEMRQYSYPDFLIWPGSSELRILFEGIYAESDTKNGGDRVLCMLGNAVLPSRQPDSTDPWEWIKDIGSNNFQLPLLQDERILLLLRYPKTFTLTRRAVIGVMRSLNPRSSLRYFDKLRLSSQLGAYSNYQFGSEEELVSKACSPYPFQDDVVGGRFEVYKGTGFCGVLDQFISGEVLHVVPNWNCNSTDEYCSKLGPFASEREIKATDGGFTNVGIMMQDIRCEPRAGRDNVNLAKVSAVFRAIPPWELRAVRDNVHWKKASVAFRAIPTWENRYSTAVAQRTGLNYMTLSAEGIWNSSVGQLCMVGCLGVGDGGCHSRICLYIPTSFSIDQRSIIFGRISSINDSGRILHYPLSFEKPVHPMQLLTRLSNYPYGGSTYRYSKIKLAGAFLERSEPFDFRTVIKKSLLGYPRKGDDNDDLVNLSNLADDLTLHTYVLPDPLPKIRIQRPFLQMEILSLGSLFGRSWAYQNVSDISVAKGWTPATPKAVSTEKELLLNMSAELTLSGKPYGNVSVLYLEGLYNPVDGKMYLIGCRDIRASWKILFESMDLEDGLDCLIEVKVEYPPTTARWLINPTAKISIASQRNDDDPLRFNQINLQTLPILYQQQRQDILSRRGVEGILRILTLSIAIICILSQLLYIKDNASSTPFISFVMLGVQALGYSIPLITGAEALFARLAAEHETPSYEFEKNQWFQIMDYLVKILVLAAFLLTLRLGQKVWKSRIRLLTRTPLEPRRVPNDKLVLLFTSGMHVVCFLVILVVHYINASRRPIREDIYIDSRGNSHRLHEWGIQLEEYIGLVQDFFLLPQIIGNFLWQINCKPLRKAYYIGMTVVRLLPHVYDYIRAPVFNPYFSEEYEFVNPSLDFYSRFGDVAIPVTASVLAIIVFIQQKWNYEKLSQTLRSQKTLLALGSSVYERIPSMSFEAELVSGVNETKTQDNSRRDEE